MKETPAHRVHPRSRGDNIKVTLRANVADGSSPLTRGKRELDRLETRRQRLIPTHAGKTSGRSVRGRYPWAHPHSRGENNGGTGGGAGMLGSSPLMRGKRAPSGDTGQRPGLIPAHAGKTGSRSCRLRPSTAHPHSCGENVRLPSVLRGAGLIPTHAGKTSCSSPSRPSTRAHPRSHWENDVSTASSRQSSGLSPLTEGKLLGCHRDCGQLRLTPAHTGQTPRSRGENTPTAPPGVSETGSSPLTRGKPGYLGHHQ